MCEGHFYCMFCGYDLYGIPEIRCPECGSGFDRASVLIFSSQDGSQLCRVIRGVIRGSVYSAACATAAIAAPMRYDSGACFALVAATMFSAVWLARRFPELKPPSFIDWSIFWPVGILIIMACVAVLVLLPIICPILATACALNAWRYYRTMTMGTHSHMNLDHVLQRQMRIYNLAAFSTLSVSSLLTVFSWGI